MTESNIIQGIIVGDKTIIQQMMQEIWPDVKRYVLRRNGTEQDAQDVFHDGLMDFIDFVKDGKYQEKNWRGCFMRFCTFRWGKLWRDYKGKYLRFDFILENFPDEKEIDQESWLRFQRLPDLVQEKISELGENCKQALRLRHFENRTVGTIAELLGNTEGYTRILIHRCKMRLKKLIQKDHRFSEFR